MRHYLSKTDFPALLTLLQTLDYTCIAPQVQHGAITYAPLAAVTDLPHGVQDQQAPAHYRLQPTDAA